MVAVSSARIPVQVISGFLGSGKTSLLNELLRSDGFGRTAVIINEFGEVGLDHLFIEGREDGIIELSNGCLCCTIRGELAATLAGLPLERIDRVIVETTGLADPVPVLQAIISHPQLASVFEAAGLLTLVDALNAPQQLEEHKEARLQVALADLLIVTKLDMAPQVERAGRFAQIESLLRTHNRAAPVVVRESVELSPKLFQTAPFPPLRELAPPGHHHHHPHDVNRHGDNIFSLVLRKEGKMPRQAVEMFCELMTSAHAQHLLRLKGLVAVEGGEGPLLLHAIHGIFHEPRELASWPDPDRQTRIVIILRDLDPQFVRKLFAGFANLASPDTPDLQALTANPLAIPGYPSR